MEAGRDLDAQLHAALFNVPVEWRLCATDPDCGKWEDVEWHDETHQEGDELWGHHPVERHPCYNWLDTDEPVQRGWAAEDIANDVARAHLWKVVPFYSTDVAAAWEIVERMRQKWYAVDPGSDLWTFRDFGPVYGWDVEANFRRDRDPPYTFTTVTARAETLPHAICLAARKAMESVM